MCSPAEVHRYWKKLGAALLDRIDMRVAVEAAVPADWHAPESGQSSAEMRERVGAASRISAERLAPLGLRRNAELGPAEAEELVASTGAARRTLDQTTELLGLSGRGRHALCRIARTIADLEGSREVEREHILEAAEYRRYGDGDYRWNAA